MADEIRTKGESTRSSRAIAPVVGICLLIGIVAIASVGLVTVSNEVISKSEQQAEHERVEQSFVELSHQIEATSRRSDAPQTMSLEAGEHGAIARTETGWIRMESDNLDESVNLTIGSIEYEGDDGTRIGFEAGGVWRETGNETRMVAAPPINYDSETQTLTFPVTTIGNDETLQSGSITLDHNRTTAFSDSRVVENEEIEITIKSEYYRGWMLYFDHQVGGASIRDVNHADQTITVRVGHINLEDAFEAGITVSEYINESGEPGFDDTERNVAPGSRPDMDTTIEELVTDSNTSENRTWATTNDGPWIINGSDEQGPFENGAYYADGVYLNDSDDDVRFDLSDGNATLVVDGDVYIEHGSAEFLVENWSDETSLKIYMTGDLYVGDGRMEPETIDGNVSAAKLQVYGTSQTKAGFEGGEFTGIFYAPSSQTDWDNDVGSNHCDHQVCFHSNPEFTGAIMASSANLQGGNNLKFEYDESVADADIEVYPDGYTPPPPLTYLNIAQYEVDVSNS